MQVVLTDASNNPLVRIETPEAHIGGKPPGRALIVDFPGQKIIPVDIARRVSNIDVAVQITGSSFDPFNGALTDFVNAVRVIFMAAS
jgi:hypothetical protein